SQRPCRWGLENSARKRAPRACGRPASGAPAAAAAGPGSPADGHPPDRASAAAAARRYRKRGCRGELRHVVKAVGARPQIEDRGDGAEIELAIEMRKQLVVARGLPAQPVAQRVGIDGDQKQPGLPDIMLSRGFGTLRGGGERDVVIS